MGKMDIFLLVANITALLFLILFIIKIGSQPTAIDVYQGKTTLKYEVVDGIAVDSVVIFKKQ